MRLPALVLAAVIALHLSSTEVVAGDHDRARSAVQSGEARPLEDILARIGGRHPGRVLDARLQGSGDRLAYRIKILDPSGRVVELTVDARSGEVRDVRGGGRR